MSGSVWQILRALLLLQEWLPDEADRQGAPGERSVGHYSAGVALAKAAAAVAAALAVPAVVVPEDEHTTADPAHHKQPVVAPEAASVGVVPVVAAAVPGMVAAEGLAAGRASGSEDLADSYSFIIPIAR